MQEQQNQIKLYSLFQKLVYFTVLVDCLLLFYIHSGIPILSNLLESFERMNFYSPPLHAKITTVILIVLVAIGTKARKNKDLKIFRSIVFPLIIGLGLIISSLYFIPKTKNSNLPEIILGLNSYQI